MYCIYKDAKQKNNEPMLWLILFIFAGFIGLCFYIFSNRNKTYEKINKFYYRYLKVYFWISIITIIIILWFINSTFINFLLYDYY